MSHITDLPPELLEMLFNYLVETKDILNLSETCKKFNEIISASEKLTKKLTIYVKYPSYLQSLKATFLKSRRRYRNLQLSRSRSRSSSESHLSSIDHAFKVIGPTIKSLVINWCQLRNLETTASSIMDMTTRRRIRVEIPFNHNILANGHHHQQTHVREEARDELYKEFIAIIKHFTNLEKTVWNNVTIEKRANPNELPTFNFSSLESLEMKQCDAFCFDILSTAKNLKFLKISEPFWSNIRIPGIDNFELFLITQIDLKHLEIYSIQYPRLFHVDRSDNIKFKLDHLVLKNVFFKEKAFAENFFKTQDQLKTIDFQVQNEKVRNLDELNWYNNIIKTVLSQNSALTSVTVDKIRYKMTDCDFLSSTRNANVTDLKFNAVAEDSSCELFKMLVQKLPNLNSITYKSNESSDSDGDICFDKGTILENVKTLVIINASVKSLINVCAENLQCFEYTPKSNGKYIDDYIGGFLHRHRNIKDLRIGCKNERSYFFVSYNLCQLIVDFLNKLESISVFNFAEVNKSVMLLCSLSNLNALTLSSTQYQQFTAKTKVQCERMKLKLISDGIKYPNESREFSDD